DHDPKPASSTNSDLWLVSLTNTGEPRNITAANKAYDNTPRYSPDGRYIAYRVQRVPGYESDLFMLALYDRRAGTSQILPEKFDNWIDDLQWSDDSKTIYFSAEVEGHQPIYRLDVATKAFTKVLDDQQIDAFNVSRDGR